MALTNCYCTLAELQARMDIDDTVDDAILEAVITGVSRLIDNYCGRKFYAATETRYYTPRHADWCVIDDLLTATTVATDSSGNRTYATTWAATDYDLCPPNAATDGLPYTAIETAPQGRYSFSTISRGLKIAGSFGYSATTPAGVREACLLQAARVFKRKDAPFGIMGSTELGQIQTIARIDPEVAMMLAGVVRYGLVATS